MPAKPSRLMLACSAALLLAAVLLAMLWPAKREFASPDDFRHWAKSHGLHVWPESGNAYAVLVSQRHPAPYLMRVSHTSREIDAPEGWSGVVVVSLLPDRGSPPDVAFQVWGKVIAYGCPDLLARIDRSR
jgi:hypothetical protein